MALVSGGLVSDGQLWQEFEQRLLDAEGLSFTELQPVVGHADWQGICRELGFTALRSARLLKLINQRTRVVPAEAAAVQAEVQGEAPQPAGNDRHGSHDSSHSPAGAPMVGEPGGESEKGTPVMLGRQSNVSPLEELHLGEGESGGVGALQLGAQRDAEGSLPRPLPTPLEKEDDPEILAYQLMRAWAGKSRTSSLSASSAASGSGRKVPPPPPRRQQQTALRSIYKEEMRREEVRQEAEEGRGDRGDHRLGAVGDEEGDEEACATPRKDLLDDAQNNQPMLLGDAQEYQDEGDEEELEPVVLNAYSDYGRFAVHNDDFHRMNQESWKRLLSRRSIPHPSLEDGENASAAQRSNWHPGYSSERADGPSSAYRRRMRSRLGFMRARPGRRNLVQGAPDAPRRTNQHRDFLVQGGKVIKHGRMGAPRERQLSVSSDLRVIMWGKGAQHQIPTHLLKLATGGCATWILERARPKGEAEAARWSVRCFSLIFQVEEHGQHKDKESLDIECSSEAECDAWVHAFNWLLDHRPVPLADLQLGGGIEGQDLNPVVMASSVDGGQRPAGTADQPRLLQLTDDQCADVLRSGTVFTKHGRHGRPKPGRRLWLSQDLTVLHWTGGKGDERTIDLQHRISNGLRRSSSAEADIAAAAALVAAVNETNELGDINGLGKKCPLTMEQTGIGGHRSLPSIFGYPFPDSTSPADGSTDPLSRSESASSSIAAAASSGAVRAGEPPQLTSGDTWDYQETSSSSAEDNKKKDRSSRRAKVVKVSILKHVVAGCRTPIFRRRGLLKRPEQEQERVRRCLSLIFGVRETDNAADPSLDDFETGAYEEDSNDQPPATKDGSLGLGLELVAGRDSLDMEFTSAMERDLWYTAFCYLSRYLASPAELALRDAEDQLRETRRDLADCRKEIEVAKAEIGMAEQCDWWQCWDENEGFHYYQHRLTYESQWHAPDNWVDPGPAQARLEVAKTLLQRLTAQESNDLRFLRTCREAAAQASDQDSYPYQPIFNSTGSTSSSSPANTSSTSASATATPSADQQGRGRSLTFQERLFGPSGRQQQHQQESQQQQPQQQMTLEDEIKRQQHASNNNELLSRSPTKTVAGMGDGGREGVRNETLPPPVRQAVGGERSPSNDARNLLRATPRRPRRNPQLQSQQGSIGLTPLRPPRRRVGPQQQQQDTAPQGTSDELSSDPASPTEGVSRSPVGRVEGVMVLAAPPRRPPRHTHIRMGVAAVEMQNEQQDADKYWKQHDGANGDGADEAGHGRIREYDQDCCPQQDAADGVSDDDHNQQQQYGHAEYAFEHGFRTPQGRLDNHVDTDDGNDGGYSDEQLRQWQQQQQAEAFRQEDQTTDASDGVVDDNANAFEEQEPEELKADTIGAQIADQDKPQPRSTQEECDEHQKPFRQQYEEQHEELRQHHQGALDQQPLEHLQEENWEDAQHASAQGWEEDANDYQHSRLEDDACNHQMVAGDEDEEFEAGGVAEDCDDDHQHHEHEQQEDDSEAEAGVVEEDPEDRFHHQECHEEELLEEYIEDEE